MFGKRGQRHHEPVVSRLFTSSPGGVAAKPSCVTQSWGGTETRGPHTEWGPDLPASPGSVNCNRGQVPHVVCVPLTAGSRISMIVAVVVVVCAVWVCAMLEARDSIRGKLGKTLSSSSLTFRVPRSIPGRMVFLLCWLPFHDDMAKFRSATSFGAFRGV